MTLTFMPLLRFSAAAAAILLSALVAKADFVFVGSWNVYHPNAPWWNQSENGPLAYTGQEAAAFLFGGSPADYVISTTGEQVSAINYSAWYDVIGFDVAIFAHDYFSKFQGQYYGPIIDIGGSIETNAASAFVQDHLAGLTSTNYAFKMQDSGPVVPEPPTVVPDTGSTLLLFLGSGCLFAVLRRRFVA